MKAPWARVKEQLDAATSPEDVFGIEPDRAKAHYRRLMRATHPDYGGDQATFTRVNELWDSWNGKSPTKTLVFETKQNSYLVGDLLAKGDICNVYAAKYALGHTGATVPVVIKMTRRPQNSDRVLSEALILKALDKAVDPKYRAFLPVLTETFRHKDEDDGSTRQANVFEALRGLMSLTDVRRMPMYAGGLDARDLAWIWRRALVAIGVTHDAGYVHGCVAPEHLLIHPEKHGMVLVDWCYAGPTDTPLRFATRRYTKWMAPEVLKKEPATYGSDVYMLNQVMGYMLHPNAPSQFRNLMRQACVPEAVDRPTAKEQLAALTELLERLYGPLRFRKFEIPT